MNKKVIDRENVLEVKTSRLVLVHRLALQFLVKLTAIRSKITPRSYLMQKFESDRGDVPGWVLVVLMTTGLITAIWTIAAPRLSSILSHSLDSMNNIR